MEENPVLPELGGSMFSDFKARLSGPDRPDRVLRPYNSGVYEVICNNFT